LCGREDADIQDYFITTAFPARGRAEEIVALLASRGEPASVAAIEAEVNVRRGRLEAMLKVLEVEGAVERVDGRWARTAQPWEYPEARVSAVTALRRAEQAAMREYASTSGCRMEFLRRQLDDPEAAPCGRCDNCTGVAWSVELPVALVAEARRHLRGGILTIEPRRQWPSGLGAPSGRIPAALQLATGRALGTFGDGGWGDEVRRVRREWSGSAGVLPDDLVNAAADAIRRWAPDPPIGWVTCVPSSSSSLVVECARRLAAALGLEFVDVVRRVRAGDPQAEMENSAQQVRNVFGAFGVAGPVPSTPVLLVDDLVDSRWTVTTVGAVLREAGSGPVYPFALAWAVSS
jgi:ATP-dependent DNA helicase RecQ